MKSAGTQGLRRRGERRMQLEETVQFAFLALFWLCALLRKMHLPAGLEQNRPGVGNNRPGLMEEAVEHSKSLVILHPPNPAFALLQSESR
jgi:hypothetical protein